MKFGMSVAGVLLFAVLGSKPALADATFDVSAFWSLGGVEMAPNGNLISGVTMDCTGGCAQTLSIDTTISHGFENIDESRSSEISITNDSKLPAGTEIWFAINVSAAFPGAGVSVDNAALESASYSSDVNVLGLLGDSHGCATSGAQPSCHVNSPDVSSEFFSLKLPAPGQTEELGFADIFISGELQSVGEPTSLAMFATGVLALGFLGWRRRNSGDAI